MMAVERGGDRLQLKFVTVNLQSISTTSCSIVCILNLERKYVVFSVTSIFMW